MLDQIKQLMSKEKSLSINCGSAFILSDKGGFLENFEGVTINCKTLLASSKVYATLMSKNAAINCMSSTVREINCEIVQLSDGTIITENMDFTDKFIISQGNIIIRDNGGKALEKTEGVYVGGALFYPEGGGDYFLAKVIGEAKPYPGEAFITFGDKKLAELISGLPKDKTLVWLDGEITAIEETALKKAKSKGLSFTCNSLLITEILFKEYGNLFSCKEAIIIPDGYELVRDLLKLTESTAAIYGPKIYVCGDLILEKKDLGCLNDIESLVVTGTATIPASCAKDFRRLGKAADYKLVEDEVDNTIIINGTQTIGHDYLQALNTEGKSISIKLRGLLVFDESVTAADMGVIEFFYNYGMVIIPDEAHGALAPKIKKSFGVVRSLETLTKGTGMTLEEITEALKNDGKGTHINTGFYVLV